MARPLSSLQIVERLRGLAPKGLAAFLGVGLVGLATHTGVFTLIYHLGVGKSPAWCAGLATGTLVTWQLNRRLTFASTGRRRGSELLRYMLVTAVAQCVSYVVFKSACTVYPSLPPALALIMGAVVATLFSYSGQRFFTFAAADSIAEITSVRPQETPLA